MPHAEVQARPLTDSERAALAEQAFEVFEDIKDSLRAGRKAMWRLAANLYQFDEMAGWTLLNYDTLEGFLADPEIGIERRQYFRLKALHEEYVVRRQIPEQTLEKVDYTKADVILPAIKAGVVGAKEALADAEVLGWRDLRTRYVGGKDPSNVPADGAESDGEPRNGNGEGLPPEWAAEGATSDSGLADLKAIAEGAFDPDNESGDVVAENAVSTDAVTGDVVDAHPFSTYDRGRDVIRMLDEAMPQAEKARRRTLVRTMAVARDFLDELFPEGAR